MVSHLHATGLTCPDLSSQQTTFLTGVYVPSNMAFLVLYKAEHLAVRLSV